MDTELYSIGAFFCDEHPDLVDEVVAAARRSSAPASRPIASERRRPDRGELRDAADRPGGPLLQGGRGLDDRALGAPRPRWAWCVAGLGRGDRLAVGRRGRAQGHQDQGGRATCRSSSAGSQQDGAVPRPPDAPVTITVFTDLQCSHLRRLPARHGRPADRAVRRAATRSGSSSATTRSGRRETTLSAYAADRRRRAGPRVAVRRALLPQPGRGARLPRVHRHRRVPRRHRQLDPGLRPRRLAPGHGLASR